MKNPVVEAIQTELDARGLPYRFETGRVHGKCIVCPDTDREFFIVISTSPSDFRAPLNQVSDLRRMLRERGFIETAEQPAPIHLTTILDGRPVVDSRSIAQHFSKQHKDVLRAIDGVREQIGPEFDRRNFTLISYVDERGRNYRAYSLTRDGFSLVAMGFTGPAAMQWKLRFIDAFNAMENELSARAPAIPAELAARLERAEGEISALTELLLDPPPARPAPRGCMSERTIQRIRDRRAHRMMVLQ